MGMTRSGGAAVGIWQHLVRRGGTSVFFTLGFHWVGMREVPSESKSKHQSNCGWFGKSSLTPQIGADDGSASLCRLRVRCHQKNATWLLRCLHPFHSFLASLKSVIVVPVHLGNQECCRRRAGFKQC